VNKDVRDFIRQLPKGWTSRATRKNHVVLLSPGGRKVYIGGTPGDRRWEANTRAQMARVEREERQQLEEQL